MSLKRIRYSELNSRQKESYNFAKVAAALADYGFVCIKLDDDWQGADFLAYHKDGEQTLKVQLKARLTIDKKYVGKNLYLAFPYGGNWYLLPHDSLVEHLGDSTTYLSSQSWTVNGGYSSNRPNRVTLDWLEQFRVGE